MPEDLTPVAVGQEWEVLGGTGTFRACVVSPPFHAVPLRDDAPAWCVAIQRNDTLTPTITTCDRLQTAGRLIGYPAGEALELARALRRGDEQPAQPAALHAAALEAVPADSPQHAADVSALYRHALIEAGYVVAAGTEEPFPVCPVCAFPAESAA